MQFCKLKRTTCIILIFDVLNKFIHIRNSLKSRHEVIIGQACGNYFLDSICSLRTFSWVKLVTIISWIYCEGTVCKLFHLLYYKIVIINACPSFPWCRILNVYHQLTFYRIWTNLRLFIRYSFNDNRFSQFNQFAFKHLALKRNTISSRPLADLK